MNPEEELAHFQKEYADFDSFKSVIANFTPNEEDKKQFAKFTDVDWRHYYESMRAEEIKYIKDAGKDQIRSSIFFLFCAITLFIIHWRNAESIRKEPEN